MTYKISQNSTAVKFLMARDPAAYQDMLYDGSTTCEFAVLFLRTLWETFLQYGALACVILYVGASIFVSFATGGFMITGGVDLFENTNLAIPLVLGMIFSGALLVVAVTRVPYFVGLIAGIVFRKFFGGTPQSISDWKSKNCEEIEISE